VKAAQASLPLSAVKNLNLAEILKIDFKVVALAVLICVFTFIYGLYQKLPLQKEINSIINQRPKVAGVNPNADYSELSTISSSYKDKIDAINNLILKELYLTGELNTIPSLMPDGMMLTSMNFTKREEDKYMEFTISGTVTLADSEQEYKTVVTFYTNLKQDANFKKYFKNFNLVSVERTDLGTGRGTATKFVISCTSQ
ncbi:MAG: PilN domain-containing protein, partial [Candidatus Omnitrophica bacterium]|nr:PilN domain-containing protein [Candidatus Omnitrophota bacterium]